MARQSQPRLGENGMKIKTVEMDYDKVLALPPQKAERPQRPSVFFRTLLKAASLPDLWSVGFRCRKIGMERLGRDEPCLILMNHSSFIDLKIAASVLYPRPFNIVCTSDGFVGKNRLMRKLGCIPTKKFVTDPRLVFDMLHAVRTLKCSVLMYPEASYSFDGTATPLPDGLGKCLKLLKVPVIMIRTYGAFSRDPLYNGLKLRKVKVSADIKYLLSAQEISERSPAELNRILKEEFTFDHFRWQQEQGIRITEPFRAEGLNRLLYRCPHCQAEGQMVSSRSTLCCRGCGKKYELTEDGFLQAHEGATEFPHIPDWYRWERECVRTELAQGSYHLQTPVDIYMMVNTDCIYRVGTGELSHTASGFRLTGCDGRLDYHQAPEASYSLYSDFYWYEIGDVICIGNQDALYYCFPKTDADVVAKARLAAEELYRMTVGGVAVKMP